MLSTLFDLDKLMDDTISALETGKRAYSDVSAKYELLWKENGS